MPAPVWKAVARYRETNSGLTWSVSCWRNDPSVATIFDEFDGWNDEYLALCFQGVEGIDLRISENGTWDDVLIVPVSQWNTKKGALIIKMMPLAEYLAVRLDGDDVNRSRSIIKLHGFDVAVLDESGRVDVTLPGIVTLQNQSLIYFQQFRSNPTAKGLPLVDPPESFGTAVIEGPYVRRLGNPFTLPGQRARYTRTTP